MVESFSFDERMLLDVAVAIVQHQAVIIETTLTMSNYGASTTKKFTVQDLRSMGGTMSREEGLEQMMEWCGRELAAIRSAPPTEPDRFGGDE